MAHFDPNRYTEYQLRKQAGVITDWIKDSPKAVWNLLSSGSALMHGLGIGGALVGSYALTRATSPSHISENADLEVVKNNLMTEIATVERQVEEEKKKFEAEKKAVKERRPYDKFLNG